MAHETRESFPLDGLPDLLRSAEVGVWEIETATGSFLCSPTFTQITGVASGVSIQEFRRALVAPEDAERMRILFFACLEGKPDRYHGRFLLRSGGKKARWAEEDAVVIRRNQDGSPARLAGMLRDVTQQKNNEDRLRAENVYRQNVARQAGLGGWEWDGRDGWLRFYDDCRDMLGYGREAMNGPVDAVCDRLVHPDEAGQVRTRIRDYIAVPQGMINEEMRLKHKDGHYLWVQGTGVAVAWDEEGRAARIVGGILDIDSRVRAEQELCENICSLAEDNDALLAEMTASMRRTFLAQGRRGTVAANGPDTNSVFGADLSRVRQTQEKLQQQSRLFQAINLVAVGLAGAAPETFDAAVQDAMAMIGEAVDVDRLRVWRNYDENGEVFGREIYQWTKSPRWAMPFVAKTGYGNIPFWWDTMARGKVFNAHAGELPEAEQRELEKNSILSILAVPIFIQDTFWGFIGFDDCTVGRSFTDSEEKLLQSGGNIIISALLRNEMTASLIEAREQAIASAKAKSEFLSRMSHEIRTPMNAIIGMGAIAKRTDDLEKIGDCLRKIDASSRQLLGIINDVLDMSKIEADKFTITNAAFDFEKMLQNIFSVMQIRFFEKKQEFKYDIETIFTKKMIGDELRLSQVLLNLLSNAVKFTPEGGAVTLRVREKNRAAAGSTLHIEVADNGIGIPEEYQDKLFQSFEQADGGITRQFGGTGLGLAISKKIVTLMGGDIQVKSTQGVGSSFVFEVPVGWGEPLRDDAPPMERKKVLHALVVDDDADVLDYLAGLLRELSIRTDTTADPVRAIALAVQNESAGTPYDVILADWNMPVMDGVETALELRRISSDNLFIIMTSLADWGEIEHEAGMAGVTCFLQKPVLPSALQDILARHGGHAGRPPSPLAEEPPRRDWAGKSILLAEDIEINREIVLCILEDTGVRIDMALDGVEAVDLFRRNPGLYDVILMDMQMPNLDGIAATRQIRALDIPGSADVPIVAMTANAFKEDEEKCLAAGMTGYLAKPIDVEKLFAALAAILDAPAER
ncbi:putative Histidine kinase [uncultured delta proteobacterium]|uniref:histidine kinase n=1 Tax=uncultured delta proteobacterium TaxID=34034 RepID=A0A212K3X8_9DELT|nr:putative Histidine kinase [uncultured delta proteobacterium]